MEKNYKEIKEKLVKRGYWEFLIRPLEENEELIPDRLLLKELISKNAVRLRGWSYPFCSRDTQEIRSSNAGVMGGVDWERHKEVWQLDSSGQLVSYVGLWEDWLDEASLFTQGNLSKYPVGSIIDTVGCLYTLTEFFEFIRRISHLDYYTSGVHVEVALHKTMNRTLEVLDPGRAGLFGRYICSEESIILRPRDFSVEDLGDRSNKIAIEYVKKIFEIFDWDNQPIKVFEEDQQKLLLGRL